jgi:dienelactone hydrolase
MIRHLHRIQRPASPKGSSARISVAGTYPGRPSLPVAVDLTWRGKGDGSPPTVLVTLHGSHSAGDRYADVDAAFAGSAVSVARITTSRARKFDPTTGETFDHYAQSAFVGKTYNEEVEDFRQGIRAAVAATARRFGVAPKDVDLVMLGSSLGGTIAAQLSDEFKPRALILAAPATRTDEGEGTWPILSTFPRDPETILSPLRKYRGDVTLLRGQQDTVVALDEVEAVQAAAQRNASGVTFKQLPGDHSFHGGRQAFVDEVELAVLAQRISSPGPALSRRGKRA